MLNSKELCSNLANRAFFIDLTNFECRDKMACFDLKGRFCLAFKNFLCKIAHVFEEDTLLFSLVGKLWLKAAYQVVIFVSEICQFYVCQKSVK